MWQHGGGAGGNRHSSNNNGGGNLVVVGMFLVRYMIVLYCSHKVTYRAAVIAQWPYLLLVCVQSLRPLVQKSMLCLPTAMAPVADGQNFVQYAA